MAKRFRFNLEAVLRYRALMEDARKREFGEANRAAEEERMRREELSTDRSGLQDEIVRLYAEQAPFQSVVDSYNLIGKIDYEVAVSLKKQQQLDLQVEQRSQQLVKARQDTQVMETLKDRRKEEFNREQDRIEQSLLDELSIQSRARRDAEKRNSGEGNS